MPSPAAPTVLIVEDHDDARALYAEFLAMEGFRVIAVGDGAAALAAARIDRPDVVLMDVTMPEMDGFATMSAMKSDPALAAVPIVMLTAHVYPEHQRRAAAAGSAGFIRKPCVPDELVSAIRRILALG